MNTVIEIKQGGQGWKIYWGAMPLPAGAEAVGTVKTSAHGTGALIRLASGNYVQGNAGGLMSLPQREVAEQIAITITSGGRITRRSQTMKHGKITIPRVKKGE